MMAYVKLTKAIDIDCRVCKMKRGGPCRKDAPRFCLARIKDAVSMTKASNAVVRRKKETPSP